MWATEFVGVVSRHRSVISTVETKTGLKSDEVLKQLSGDLLALGYDVESGKSANQKITRPVLFGDNGIPSVSYDIDAFHDGLGIAVEVEAGRAASNNADYRDILRTSLILDANNLSLLVPVTYRSTQDWQVYERVRGQLDAIYASDRLRLPFDGVLLVGY